MGHRRSPQFNELISAAINYGGDVLGDNIDFVISGPGGYTISVGSIGSALDSFLKGIYTDSILALDANTGKLKWYHQEQAHDLWDYDAESPVVLFNAEIEGRRRRGVAEAGKNGLLFLLDAKTGKNLFPSVAFVKRDHSPPTRKGTLECPGAVGGS
ncbi:MAG: hypothetical protein WCH93_12380, partial [Actinomycetota bacterium]